MRRGVVLSSSESRYAACTVTHTGRYFLCLCKPLSEDITTCAVEVEDAAWLPCDDIIASSPLFIKCGLRLALQQPMFESQGEYESVVAHERGLTAVEEVARLGNRHISAGKMHSFLDRKRSYTLFYPAAALPVATLAS
jgi:hypothetical protein